MSSSLDEFYANYRLLSPERPVAEKSEGPYITRVYRAHCRRDGSEVIVKQNVIHGDSTGRGLNGINTIINQLKQEYVALQLLKENKYVVDPRGYFEDFINSREMYIVMEKAPGRKLVDYVEEMGPLPVETFVCLMQALLEAVGDMHRKGIVHRDLSYTNIFVDADPGRSTLGGIKIIDFGLAYIRGYGIRHRSALTGSFAPPEAVGQVLRRVTPSYDIYSLGVLTYYMLSGNFPYRDGSRVLPLLCSHKEERYYVPLERDDLTPGLEELLRKCLRYRPRERPQSVAELKSMIHKLKRERRLSFDRN